MIEVGSNKKEYRQVTQTAEKVKANYGIIISEQEKELQYNEVLNALKIPLKYFLLV